MNIRRFEENDAELVSDLVRRNFLEVNSKDYPLPDVEKLASEYDSEKIKHIASYAHTYVVTDDNKVVGTGSISSYWGSKTESILLTIFVLPEYHGQGIGTLIVRTLEQDSLFLRAERVEIPSSITACGFYEKLGYHYKGGQKTLDADGHYIMEKNR